MNYQIVPWRTYLSEQWTRDRESLQAHWKSLGFPPPGGPDLVRPLLVEGRSDSERALIAKTVEELLFGASAEIEEGRAAEAKESIAMALLWLRGW
jgi:hypothetical protein